MLALGQKARLIINGERVLEYPELAMEFEINFSTDSDGNTGSMKLYNLSQATIDLLKKGQKFVLYAGYRDDVGNIIQGVIVTATTAWTGIDKVTTAIIGDCTDDWLNIAINETWRAGIKASEVVNDIVIKHLKPKIEGNQITSDGIQIPNDITYTGGKTFSCTCKQALEELARDLGLKLHFSGNKLYLRPEKMGLAEIVLLNSDTGLMSSPEKIESNREETGKRYKVQSLLNHRLRADTVVKIESKTIEGLWRISKGKHLLNGEDFHTEMEVVKYE